MSEQSAPSKISNQLVAVVAILLAAVMTFGAFFLSRADHDLKLMSLQSVLTLGGTLTGIAGTLLVGVTGYKQIVAGNDAKITTTDNTAPKSQGDPQ